jgi:hypothetical protein
MLSGGFFATSCSDSHFGAFREHWLRGRPQHTKCFSQSQVRDCGSIPFNSTTDILKEDNEDSTKWRTMTIKRLEELGVTKEIDQVRTELAKQFQIEVLDKIGYKFEKDLDNNRLNKLLTVAIELAQLLAKQRAIFAFRVPKLDPGEFKGLNSTDMTNKDDEYDEVEEEMEGKVWFVIQPMLVKFGTGKGERLHEHTVVRPAYVELERGCGETVE